MESIQKLTDWLSKLEGIITEIYKETKREDLKDLITELQKASAKVKKEKRDPFGKYRSDLRKIKAKHSEFFKKVCGKEWKSIAWKAERIAGEFRVATAEHLRRKAIRKRLDAMKIQRDPIWKTESGGDGRARQKKSFSDMDLSEQQKIIRAAVDRLKGYDNKRFSLREAFQIRAIRAQRKLSDDMYGKLTIGWEARGSFSRAKYERDCKVTGKDALRIAGEQKTVPPPVLPTYTVRIWRGKQVQDIHQPEMQMRRREVRADETPTANITHQSQQIDLDRRAIMDGDQAFQGYVEERFGKGARVEELMASVDEAASTRLEKTTDLTDDALSLAMKGAREEVRARMDNDKFKMWLTGECSSRLTVSNKYCDDNSMSPKSPTISRKVSSSSSKTGQPAMSVREARGIADNKDRAGVRQSKRG